MLVRREKTPVLGKRSPSDFRHRRLKHYCLVSDIPNPYLLAEGIILVANEAAVVGHLHARSPHSLCGQKALKYLARLRVKANHAAMVIGGNQLVAIAAVSQERNALILAMVQPRVVLSRVTKSQRPVAHPYAFRQLVTVEVVSDRRGF